MTDGPKPAQTERIADLETQIGELKEKIEQLKLDQQNATRTGDYTRASQIQYGDLPEFDKWPYIANVARVNTAALAALALAPARPKDVHVLTTRLTNDTDLEWTPNTEPYFDHYEIVWRDTTEAMWTHSKAIGSDPKYTAKDMSKDNWFFGVRAVGKDGVKSPVSYPTPVRR